MHSSASDGILSPRALAEECFSLGLTHVSLTDHDTISGQEEFLSAAKAHGMCAVSGVELNCEHTQELHILGYGFDLENSALCETLYSLAKYRKTRAAKIVENLSRSGYPISLERVHELAGEGVVGRPHIAKALVEKGYVQNIPQAFQKLLGDGCPGEAPRWRIPHGEAMALIRNAGGRAVLAHPGCMKGEDYERLVQTLSAEGLEGIEAFYPEHTREECEYFCALAEKYHLFLTMGSDFHGGIGHAPIPGFENRGTQKVIINLKKNVGNCCLFNR